MNCIRGLGSSEKAADLNLIKLAEAIDPAAGLVVEPTIDDCVLNNSTQTTITVVNHTAFKINFLCFRDLCALFLPENEMSPDALQPMLDQSESMDEGSLLTIDREPSTISFTNDDCQVIAYHLKANKEIILLDCKDIDKNEIARFYLSTREIVYADMEKWHALEPSGQKCQQAFLNARKDIAFNLLWAGKEDLGSTLNALWDSCSDVFKEIIKTYISIEGT